MNSTPKHAGFSSQSAYQQGKNCGMAGGTVFEIALRWFQPPSVHSSLPVPDIWDCKFGPAGCGGLDLYLEEEEPAERVESGRDVRAKMFARLNKQNCLERPEMPDVGWVSELVN